MVFLILLKRENIFPYIISILIPITFTNIPFIFLIAFYLFERKVFPEFLRDLFLSLFAFYAGAGFLLKTRVHLAYPFYYPLFISLFFSLSGLSKKMKKFRIIILTLLIWGFFTKKSNFLGIDVSFGRIEEEEIKYNYSKDPAFLDHLWFFYLSLGNVEKAIEITKKIPYEFSPADYTGKWADIYLLLEKKEDAKKFAIKSSYLGNPFSLLTLGEILMKEEPEKALKLLEKAFKLKISPARSIYLLKEMYFQKKDTINLKKIEEISKKLEIEF